MSFFARLVTKPPTAEELVVLKHCAGPDNQSKPPVELARTVIDKALTDEL
jgi:hypothetical protein